MTLENPTKITLFATKFTNLFLLQIWYLVSQEVVSEVILKWYKKIATKEILVLDITCNEEW